MFFEAKMSDDDLLKDMFGDPGVMKILREDHELEVTYELGECPSEEEIVRYAEDKSSPEETVRMRRHASRCETCLRFLIEIGAA